MTQALTTTNGQTPAEITTQPKTKGELFREFLDEHTGRLEELCAQGANIGRVKAQAMLACLLSPDLLECDPVSLLTAVGKASNLGLDCTGRNNSAFLIPFRGKCVLMPGYGGLIDLMTRNGRVSSVTAHVVHKADVFHVEFGTTPQVVHSPDLEGSKKDNEITYVYAVAFFADGSTPQFEVMTREQVEVIRKASKQANGIPWSKHWGEMARKTVIRRFAKYIPQTPDLTEAIGLVDEHEGLAITDNRPDRNALPATDDLANAIAAKNNPAAHAPVTGGLGTAAMQRMQDHTNNVKAKEQHVEPVNSPEDAGTTKKCSEAEAASLAAMMGGGAC